jgi:RHS repeat-associated protein
VDYTVEEGEPTEVMRYLAGFGIHAQEAVGQASPPVYLHGDLIRSTMLMTDEGGTGVSPVIGYTAFGDPVTPDGQGGWRIGFPPELGTRYQYAGGWGYETGGFDGQSGILMLYGGNPDLPPITLQHVGWRWYQPSTGRFIQRDPIGVKGGLNVYAYVAGVPTVRADALGLAAGVVDWIGTAFLGGIGGALGGAAGPIGAGIGAATGAALWFAGKEAVTCVAETAQIYDEAAEIERKTKRDRERIRQRRPDLFPPPPAPPPPLVPCGPHY